MYHFSLVFVGPSHQADGGGLAKAYLPAIIPKTPAPSTEFSVDVAPQPAADASLFGTAPPSPASEYVEITNPAAKHNAA